MKRMILESPFAGNEARNIAYAKLCILDMLYRDEAPIASHLLFTQPGILRDSVPEDRKLGIEAGLVWVEVADGQAFYTDFGWSRGMNGALERAKEKGTQIEIRQLSPEVVESLKQQYPDQTT